MTKRMKWTGYFSFNDQKLDFKVRIDAFGVCEYEIIDEAVFNAEKGSREEDEFIQREICELLRTFCNKEFTDTEQLLKEYPIKNHDFIEFAEEKVQEKGIKFNGFIVRNVDMNAGSYDMYKAMEVQRRVEAMAKQGTNPATETPTAATVTNTEPNPEPNPEPIVTGNNMMKKILMIAVVVIILIVAYFMK